MLNKKIEILHVVRTKDKMQATVQSLEPFYSCYAYVNGLSGKEYFEAKERNLQETVNFTIRYIPKLADLNTKDYVIKFRNQIFDLTHIDNYQFNNETLKIFALARDSEGIN